MGTLTLFDGHVHVHKQTDVAAMLSGAARNFAVAAAKLNAPSWRGVLLLTEMAHRDWFTETALAGTATFGSWRIAASGADAINAHASNGSGAVLTMVSGYQIITKERIEVLALGTRKRTADGASLESTIGAAQSTGALVVLPWGAGKWLGTRGRLVQEALQAHRKRQIFAGDNRGRPAFLGYPVAFVTARQRKSHVLPGTDPLALPGEETQVGALGFAISGRVPETIDGRSLYELLSEETASVRAYGRHIGPFRFIRNQMALRMRNERYP